MTTPVRGEAHPIVSWPPSRQGDGHSPPAVSGLTCRSLVRGWH